MISAASSSACSTAPARPGARWCERRHPVEEVRRVAGAGGDRVERLVVGRARMTERHPVPARREPLARDRCRRRVPAQASRCRRPASRVRSRRGCPRPRTPTRRPARPARRLARRPAWPAGPERSPTRKQSEGCAPQYSELMKLLSRCAGSTRAARGDGDVRARRTWSSTPRSGPGAHATVVGQNAVTP